MWYMQNIINKVNVARLDYARTYSTICTYNKYMCDTNGCAYEFRIYVVFGD